jgi:hypothetical protein
VRPGARSIRGAMGAYALAGLLAVVLLGLVLWVGGPEPQRCLVALPADSPWSSAALDDGRSLRTVLRGERIEAPPARYRVTLLDAQGRTEQRTLDVSGPLTTL